MPPAKWSDFCITKATTSGWVTCKAGRRYTQLEQVWTKGKKVKENTHWTLTQYTNFVKWLRYRILEKRTASNNNQSGIGSSPINGGLKLGTSAGSTDLSATFRAVIHVLAHHLARWNRPIVAWGFINKNIDFMWTKQWFGFKKLGWQPLVYGYQSIEKPFFWTLHDHRIPRQQISKPPSHRGLQEEFAAPVEIQLCLGYLPAKATQSLKNPEGYTLTINWGFNPKQFMMNYY